MWAGQPSLSLESLQYLMTRTLTVLNLIKSTNSAMLGPGPAAPLRAVGWMRATGLCISRYINYDSEHEKSYSLGCFVPT